MEIKNKAIAGTIESNDIMIKVSPNTKREVILDSTVIAQFGDQIERVINDTLDELGITNILVEADDKGAIDYTIIARVKTAVLRGTK